MTSPDHLGHPVARAVAPAPRRRLRRLAAGAVAATLALSLVACGSEDSSILDEYSGAKGFDAVTIAGEQGQEPEVTWKDAIHADKLQVDSIDEGDGPKVKNGDQVLMQYWIGNGFSKTTVQSSYGQPVEPQQVSGDLGPVFSPILDGRNVGSRVAVIADPKTLAASGIGAGAGIGDGDSALIIGDVVGILKDGPSGKKEQPAAWAPTVVEKTVKKVKQPTSLDFEGTPEPTKQLGKTFLIRGDGPALKDGQSVTVNYLGQVYEGKEPFDESYSEGKPFSFLLGKDGSVVDGWKQGLKGVPIGSRVILSIPPKLGYGTKGNTDGSIKGTDTMYFVIDVLGAA